MKKNVWIMNHYASNMFFDQGGRHYNFAKYLKRMGYEPVIFCANSKHNAPSHYFETDALWEEHPAEQIGVPFVFVKARTYTGNGAQRIRNMIDFYRNVQHAAKEYAKLHPKPDIVYASSVHPLTLVAGIQLAKFFGVKCICEVRDLWPEAIVDFGIAGPRHPAVIALRRLEKWIYKKADALIFTMEGGYDYIVEQGWEKEIPRSKVFHINNGVDLETFRYNLEHYPVDDSDLCNPDTFKVVYTGAIRKINNLGLILDAAKEITDPRIRFLIWGPGDEVPALRQRVKDEQIQNVIFKGHVNKKYIPSIVSQSDLNLVHWNMADLLRFGVSYNKLFDYLAAGKPIFSTVRPGYTIIEYNQCGFDTKGFTAHDFALGIQELANLPLSERQRFGENAAKTAVEYDFANLTKKLAELLT